MSSEGCFPVAPEHATIADKPSKRKASTSWIKRGFQTALTLAAAFSAIVAPGSKLETVHQIGATIYGDFISVQAISGVVEAFPSLWKDTGNVTNVPEDQWMEIPLIEN